MASYLLPAAAITLLLFVVAPSASVADLVLDGNGEPLRNGADYYILPHLIGTGGLTVTGGSSSLPCPLFITQERYSHGSPLTISSPLRILFLPTSLPVQFSFEHLFTSCNEKLRWWVAPKDEHGNSYVVAGSSGPFKSTYAFKIEKAETGKNVYNIKFCHTTESNVFRVSETESCKDVTFIEDGLLGVAHDSPYPVTFMKAATPRLASYV